MYNRSFALFSHRPATGSFSRRLAHMIYRCCIIIDFNFLSYYFFLRITTVLCLVCTLQLIPNKFLIDFNRLIAAPLLMKVYSSCAARCAVCSQDRKSMSKLFRGVEGVFVAFSLGTLRTLFLL